jgi:hypothetical protein
MEKPNMHDSSHEHVVDPPTKSLPINRREMAKLLGAITALSASLGVTFVTSAATVPEGAQLKLKFFKQAPNGDPAKAELLCTIEVSPEDRSKLVAANAPVELRVVHEMSKNIIGNVRARETPQEVTISSQTISTAAWTMVKIKAN